VNALIKKGALLHTAGRYPEAKATLVEALTLDPQNLGALQTLAHAENALGEPERSLSLFRQLASLRGLDEELARMIGDQMWAVDEKRRNSSTYKDFEEGCPPIEEVIAEIEGGPIRNDPYNPTLLAEAIERLSRQIAAQTSVLGRLNASQNDHDYFLIQQRFRNMALHSYQGTLFKVPEDPAPEIPETMRSAFSMDGRIELSQGYVNSALPPECGEGIDDNAVRTFLALNYESLPPNAKPGAARIIERFVPTQHSQTTKVFARGMPLLRYELHSQTTNVFARGMLLPRVESGDRSVAAVGSPDYYLDSILICLCRELTSVRLRNVIGSTELFRTAFLFDWLREDTKYDLIICPSILGHWGLGRHGEPLDPDGDIALMRRFREKLRPTGSCYVQLPIGRDRLIFNAMRVYGTHRLGAILEGWRPKSPERVSADRLAARVPVRENFLLEPN
jgi:tetratricopeptide (TPR) repeat protein